MSLPSLPSLPRTALARAIYLCVLVPAAMTAVAQDGPDAKTLDEVVVVGERNYLRPAVVTASKTDTPQMELPISVSAVTRQLLDDQQAFRAADGLKNVASFQSGYSYGPIEDSFYLRGFYTGDHFGSAAYRDGVRMAAFNIPTAGLEAIEVLKGPGSALYGRAEPGGIVNFVTKKPVWSSQHHLDLQVGSDAFRRGTADLGGPIGENLAYRLVADHVDTDSFRDYVSQEQQYVLAALTWRPTDRTELEIQLDWRDLKTIDDLGMPIVGNRPAPIPLGRYLGEPGAGHADREDYSIDVDLSHHLSDAWTLRAKGYRSKFDQSFVDISFGALDTATGDLQRSFFADDNINEVDFGSLELAGRLQLGSTGHDVLFGIDRYVTTLSEEIWYNFTDATAIGPINIYNPIYGNSRRPILDPSMVDRYGAANSWTGVYAQDLISVAEQWRIMTGVRHDRTKYSNTYSPATDDSQTSGRLGVVFLPSEKLSLFATAANGFGRANGRNASGSLAPEESFQLEAGVKYAPFGDRLIVTGALYDIRKKNVLTADLSTPDPTDVAAIGEVRSRGIELEAAGWLTSRWSVQTSYAYNDLEVTKDDGTYLGNRLQNAPEHAASLWNRYDLTSAFTAGLGVYHVGKRWGDDVNTYELPGYTRVDLMAQYRFGADDRFTLTANVENVFDKVYYGSGSDFYLAAVPGAPRTLRVGVRFKF